MLDRDLSRSRLFNNEEDGELRLGTLSYVVCKNELFILAVGSIIKGNCTIIFLYHVVIGVEVKRNYLMFFVLSILNSLFLTMKQIDQYT